MKFVSTSVFRFLMLIGGMFTATIACSQDLHFSQFNNSPANLNPALTGVFAGDLRFIANYRSQWHAVPVDYRTLSGSFDSKLFHKAFGRNGYLGYGLVFNNDVAGEAEIGMSQLGANVAFTRKVTNSLFISVGAQFSLGQRAVSPQKLTFEEQWNGDVFDPTTASGETFISNTKAISSISTGLNLHYQLENVRTKIDFGIGFFHLNQPNTSFDGNPKVELPLKFTPYILSTLQLRPKLDLVLRGQFSKQLSYRESVAGTGLRYHFNLEKNKELSAQAGFAYRFGDALIPSLEVQHRNWTAGFSYDHNFSDFRIATNHRGGPEFFLQYLLWKVHPPKEHKACPIF